MAFSHEKGTIGKRPYMAKLVCPLSYIDTNRNQGFSTALSLVLFLSTFGRYSVKYANVGIFRGKTLLKVMGQEGVNRSIELNRSDMCGGQRSRHNF